MRQDEWNETEAEAEADELSLPISIWLLQRGLAGAGTGDNFDEVERASP